MQPSSHVRHFRQLHSEATQVLEENLEDLGSPNKGSVLLNTPSFHGRKKWLIKTGGYELLTSNGMILQVSLEIQVYHSTR